MIVSHHARALFATHANSFRAIQFIVDSSSRAIARVRVVRVADSRSSIRDRDIVDRSVGRSVVHPLNDRPIHRRFPSIDVRRHDRTRVRTANGRHRRSRARSLSRSSMRRAIERARAMVSDVARARASARSSARVARDATPIAVARARASAFVETHAREVEVACAVACAIAAWRATRAMKATIMDVASTNAVFDVAYGDVEMLSASAMFVASAAFALRKRYALDVEYATRVARERFAANASVRELLGAPVTIGESKVVVLSGGGLTAFKRTRSTVFGAWRAPVSVDSKWAHVAFEVRGTRKTGVASVGAKKWAGAFTIPLLALDVDSANGETYRIFLEGGQKEYEASGVLASLREPLKASISKEMKRLKADADAFEAEAAAREVARRRMETAPKPLDAGGGMYRFERVSDAVASALHFIRRSFARARVSKSNNI